LKKEPYPKKMLRDPRLKVGKLQEGFGSFQDVCGKGDGLVELQVDRFQRAVAD
jgi:hypothetical protein